MSIDIVILSLRLLFISLLIAVLASCNDSACSAGVCTKEFAIISLEIKDPEGETIQLDSSQTYRNDELIYSQHYSEANSYHSVITDSQLSEVEFSGSALTFKGWLAGQLVAEADFVIGKDCCHIEKLEGPEVITLP